MVQHATTKDIPGISQSTGIYYILGISFRLVYAKTGKLINYSTGSGFQMISRVVMTVSSS